jgi:ATP-dependent helicase HrpA
VRDAAAALAENARLNKAVSRVSSLAVLDRLTAIREHAARLVGDRFVSRVGVEHLGDLVRYLKADAIRLEKLQEDPARDARLAWEVDDLEQYWDKEQGKLPASRRAEADAQRIDWLLEELRVSLFAQVLGTKETVSDKRVRQAIAAL